MQGVVTKGLRKERWLPASGTGGMDQVLLEVAQVRPVPPVTFGPFVDRPGHRLPESNRPSHHRFRSIILAGTQDEKLQAIDP